VSQRNLAVEFFRKSFQVDVGGVDVLVDFEEGFALDVAVGDHDGVETAVMGFAGDVDDVLAPDGRLVVGEGQRGCAVFFREVNDFDRREMGGADMVGTGLRDVEVLAELASHVAAGSAHGKDSGAGEEVVEGLLLDRVHGDGGGASVTELNQAAVFVLADIAEAGLAFADVAVTRAEITVQAPVGHGFPPAGSGGLLRDCGHDY
jgi:hypothetical protein